jgi:hypothetical protein
MQLNERSCAMKRKPLKLKMVTVTIPEETRKAAAYFLGEDITTDADFWKMILRDGVREFERQFDEVMAEGEQRLAILGTEVIEDDDGEFDPDDLPF